MPNVKVQLLFLARLVSIRWEPQFHALHAQMERFALQQLRLRSRVLLAHIRHRYSLD
jgi:hypothetical protein